MRNPDTILKDREQTDFECFKLLKQILTHVSYDPGIDKFKNILLEYCGDQEEVDEIISQMKELTENRDNLTDEFLESLKGLPPMRIEL